MLFSFALFLSAIHIAYQQLPTNQIDWQPGNWALNCDFPGNDFAQEGGAGELCSTMCANTPDCTHYAWAYNVCYKKRGSVNKQMAIVNHTPGSVCGIVHETPISGGPNRGQLIFSNEFDSINEVTQNWIQETGGHGWGNNELQ
jgi:hypothetical protein